MSDDLNSPWGVPADAPPPRRRTTWGTGDPTGAPVGRGSTPSDEPSDEPVVETPQWSPIVPDDTFTGAADAAPAPEPATDDYPFGVIPEHLTAAQPAAAAQPPAVPEPDDRETVDTPTPDVSHDDTGDAGDSWAGDTLPAAVPVFEAPVAVAGDNLPAADLASMFDDEVPVAAAPEDATPAVPADAEAPVSFANQSEALAAWRAAQQQRAHDTPSADAAAASNLEAALTHRYASYIRLQEVVDRILGLAQTGNPRVQATINSFVLSRDKDVDAHQRATYQELMTPVMAANFVHIDNPADSDIIFDIAYDELIGIGPLGPLWRDDSVTEILVSGPDKVVCERDGQLLPTPVKFRNLEHLRTTARDLAQRVDDRVLSRSNALVTAQLPGARVQFAVAPVAPVAGVSITIRKFRPLFGIDQLLQLGALSEEMAAFLSDAVGSRATILVSGGTGSGKTTMINALSAFIPDSERVITIEDALELTLTNNHVEQLLTKELASGDDKVLIGQDELLRASLRMRPDRIIVGEIRDGRGCAVMLQAANTGHDGTMTTVHANNPDRALRRLSLLLRSQENMSDEVAAEEVSMAFDLVVQVVRRRGRRFVSAIAAVDKDQHKTVPLFTGTYGPGDSVPTFARVGRIGADTELGQRFADAGLDLKVWG